MCVGNKERAIHGIRKLECQYCHELFTHSARDNLNKHLEEVHNEKVIKRSRNQPLFRSNPTKINQHVRVHQNHTYKSHNFDALMLKFQVNAS